MLCAIGKFLDPVSIPKSKKVHPHGKVLTSQHSTCRSKRGKMYGAFAKKKRIQEEKKRASVQTKQKEKKGKFIKNFIFNFNFQ